MYQNFLISSQQISIKPSTKVLQQVSIDKCYVSPKATAKKKDHVNKFMQISQKNFANQAYINVQKSIQNAQKKNYVSQFEKRKQALYKSSREISIYQNNLDNNTKLISKNIFVILRVLKDICSQFRLLCDEMKYFFSVQSTIWKRSLDRGLQQISKSVEKFDKFKNLFDGCAEQIEATKVPNVNVDQQKQNISLSRIKTAQTLLDNQQLNTEKQKAKYEMRQTNCFMKISYAQSQQFGPFSFNQPYQHAQSKQLQGKRLSKLEFQLQSIGQIIDKMNRLAR